MFELPTNRDEFMRLVQKIAKEDVKRCLAGVVVTHPHFVRQVLQDPISTTEPVPNQSKHHLTSQPTVHKDISRQHQEMSEIIHHQPVPQIIIQEAPIEDIKKSTQPSTKSSSLAKPTSNVTRRTSTGSSDKENQRPSSQNPSKPISSTPSNIIPPKTTPHDLTKQEKTSPRSKTSPNTNYERLLKPTVSTQKKFEKEVVKEKKEKEFKELRKEQKKTTSLLLRKPGKPVKKTPPKEKKTDGSFSEALSLSSPMKSQPQFKPQLEPFPEYEQQSTNSSSVKSDGDEKENHEESLGSISSHEEDYSSNESHTHDNDKQQNISISPRIYKPKQSYKMDQAFTNVTPRSISPSQQNANSQAASLQMNYEKLEDLVINDLLTELAKEEKKSQTETASDLQLRKQYNKVQFEEILQLLSELELNEAKIRNRYSQGNCDNISLESSLTSSTITSSSSQYEEQHIGMDIETRYELRKRRKKSQYYFERFCQPLHDLPVDLLMQQ